jgi:hypothetical protein
VPPDATTTPATLTVNSAPAFTVQPTGQTVLAGLSANFTVAASGKPAPTYTWQEALVGTNSFSNLSLSGNYSGVTTTTLTVSGTTAAMSGNQYQCVASNGVSPDATSIPVTLTVQTLFQQWQISHFGVDATNPSIAGDLADPDKDGIPNLLEYALNSDPRAPSSSTLPVASSAIDSADSKPHLLLTASLNALATDITVFAEVSSDLVTWNSGPTFTEIASDTPNGSMHTVVFRDLTPLSSGVRRFIRLKVTRP